MSTPASLGFRMPAEWEPHVATWLAWPHEASDWPGKFAPVQWVYASIIRRLSLCEEVRILVADEAAEKAARNVVKATGVGRGAALRFFRQATDRSWSRDFCPLFVRNREETAITDWHFNGWAKYPNHLRDDAVTQSIAPGLGMRSWQPRCGDRRVVLEGGSIDVNGRGCLLTTEECLLSPVQARNPGMSREDIEQTMGQYLGVTKVLWLNRGIAGDDTHGHIDDLARFVNPTTVVTVVEPNTGDENYEPLQENLDRLHLMTDQDGNPLLIETLPMPDPIYFRKQRLPASYANFYVANCAVFVPTFDDPSDVEALNTLARLFPDREIVGIHCLDLVLGLGTLHCMTMQQPA